MDARGDLKHYVAWSIALVAIVLGAVAATFDGLVRQSIVGIGIVAAIVFVVSAIRLDDDARRRSVAESLAADGYTGAYARLMKPVLALPRDWRLYDFALRLAVAYPIVLALGTWATAQPILLGDLEVVPPVRELSRRIMMIVAFATSLFLYWLAMSDASFPLRVRRKVAERTRLPEGVLSAGAVAVAIACAFAVASAFTVAGTVALTGAFAVAVAGAFAGARAVAGAVAVAGAGAGAVAGAVAGAGSVAGAGAVGVAVAGAVARTLDAFFGCLKGRGHAAIGYLAFTLLLLIGLTVSLAALPIEDVPFEGRMLIVFFAILPLLNAILDALSYRITLGLIAFGAPRGAWALVVGLFDLALAFVLFTALGLVLVAALAFAERLSGVALLPLGPLLADLEDGKWHGHAWVVAMLFSTIVPTLLHAMAACFSLTGLVPRAARERLAALAASENAGERFAFVAGYAALWTAAIVAAALAMAAILGGIYGFHPPILDWYLSLFSDWAGYLGAS